MSTAQFYFHESWTATAVRTARRQDVVILFIAVAVCCASFVFAILFSADQRYPVAAIKGIHGPVAAQSPAATNVSKSVAALRVGDEPIARNHSELLTLERSGQRNYIEFSLPRSNTFEPVGPIQLGFWRVDTRHDAVQGSVLIGQRRVDIKHIGVNERVTIPITNGDMLELVVNRVSKSQISGYISEPKGTSELALNAGSKSAVVP
jgi:hypothetical protein